jgi:hypothetical protein
VRFSGVPGKLSCDFIEIYQAGLSVISHQFPSYLSLLPSFRPVFCHSRVLVAGIYLFFWAFLLATYRGDDGESNIDWHSKWVPIYDGGDGGQEKSIMNIPTQI